MSYKEICDHFKQEGHVMKGAPIAFISSVLLVSGLLCGGAYWLVDHLYSAESRAKDATIQNLQQQLQAKQPDTGTTATPTSQSNEQQVTSADDSVSIGPGARAYGGSVAIGKNATAGAPQVQQGPDSALSVNQSGGITAGTYIGTNQTQIYQGPKPFIDSQKWLITNALEAGRYKNIYMVDVGNPADRMNWDISGMPPLVSNIITENAGGGQAYNMRGSFSYIDFKVTVMTAGPVIQSNFIFGVRAVPSQ
jgi:hypothetical protein